jgi:hypothetical protein
MLENIGNFKFRQSKGRVLSQQAKDEKAKIRTKFSSPLIFLSKMKSLQSAENFIKHFVFFVNDKDVKSIEQHVLDTSAGKNCLKLLRMSH